MTGATDVVRWSLDNGPGVLVTLEDAKSLTLDAALTGNAFIEPTDSWVFAPEGPERVYRRIDPEQIS